MSNENIFFERVVYIVYKRCDKYRRIREEYVDKKGALFCHFFLKVQAG